MVTLVVPSPYERQVFRGRLVDNATMAALLKVESVLGYELTILQGIGDAGASSDTHVRGRAVDLAWYDQQAKMKAMRDVGFAYWPREELPGTWPAHGHGVLIFENRGNQRGISASAFAQIGKYDRGEDGLANPPTPDPNPYRPTPKAVFTLAEYEFVMKGGLEAPVVTDIMRMRDKMVEAVQDLSAAIAIGKTIPGHGHQITDAVDDMRAARRVLVKRLDELPKR